MRDKKTFADAHPSCRDDLPALYVGQTGLAPEERFAKHRAGVKANPYADHGLRLRTDSYEHLGPMTWEASCAAEQHLGQTLREAGYAVWVN